MNKPPFTQSQEVRSKSTVPRVASETPEKTATVAPVLPPAPQLEEEFDVGDVVEAAEELLRASAPHDYQVLVLGGGCAGIAAARRAAELGARVGLVDPHLLASSGDFDDTHRVPLDIVLDTWHEALLARRTLIALGELSGMTSEIGLDPEALWRRAALEAEKRRTARRRSLEAAGVELLAGRAHFVEEHTVEIVGNARDSKRVRAIHIILATGARSRAAAFPGAALGVQASRETFAALLHESGEIAVIGSDSFSLEWAALLGESGKKVTLVRGTDELWCDATVRCAREVLHENGVSCCEAGSRLALESDGEQVRLRGTKSKTTSFSTVLVTDRAIDHEALQLGAAGIEFENGRVAIDARGETGISGVHAAGACAWFDCDAALAVAQGTRLAETILRAEERTDVAHAPRRLRLVPELAATGLSESDAWALGVPARAVDGRWGKGRHLRLVAGEDGLLLGCQACGDGSADLVRQAAMALRAGWTASHWAQLLPETSAAPWLSALREAARKLG
ncbi:MAG TPA: FAD-dependent oxidoreductase [Abditibacteriaceae bacterium]